MNWTEVIARVAEEADVPKNTARRVLSALGEVGVRALCEGEDVPIRRLGLLRCSWRKGRMLRSVSDYRKIRLDGRYVVQFRPADTLRKTIADRTPQRWRDPGHQEAWRVADTLVSDLGLYHAGHAPSLPADAEPAHIEAACAEAFGSLWDQARSQYRRRVPDEVRQTSDYLAEAARRRWAS